MNKELKNQSSVFEQRVLQLTEENDNFRKRLRDLGDENRKIA
jgi:molecular chaperone GrpE (heat shock protein)